MKPTSDPSPLCFAGHRLQVTASHKDSSSSPDEERVGKGARNEAILKTCLLSTALSSISRWKRGSRSRHLAYIALLLVSFGLAPARGGESPAPSAFRRWAEQDYMLGDWGGLRSNLSRHGADFEFFYAGSIPDNLDGGIRPGGLYQGALLMTLDLDSRKLGAWEGGTLHASGLWLQGQKPFSDRYVGDYNKVNLLDFPNAARLWELWYQQKMFDGRLSLKAGELSIDRDFLVPELYTGLGQSTLINQTFFYPSLPYNVFDMPGFPPRRHGLATTPYATPGVVLRWSPRPSVYLQTGVYGGNPDQSYSGTRFNLSEEEGALSYFEVGFHPNLGTNQPGLEGSYKLGAYYHTGEFVDMNDAVAWAFARQAGSPLLTVRNRSGNEGAYLLAEQQLYYEKGKQDPAQQGLVGFFRLAGAPPDRNLTQLEVDGGLVFRGLLPTRDWDTLALAASYLGFSDNVRDAQRQINKAFPGAFTLADYETVLEMSYKIQATAWWTVQPSLQHVFHPGGSSTIPDATVFILQTTLRF